MGRNRKDTEKKKVFYLNQFDIPYFLYALDAYERDLVLRSIAKGVPITGYMYAREWIQNKRKELNGNKTNSSDSNLQPVG